MTRHNSTLYAGLGVGVGLFAIRLVAAGTIGDLVFAAALTATEFSVVWLWERKCCEFGERIKEWEAAEGRQSRTRGSAEAAQQNLASRQRLVRETEREIEAMEREFERDHLLSDIKALTGIATNAIEGGYHAGIAANVAAVSGGPSLEDDTDENE